MTLVDHSPFFQTWGFFAAADPSCVAHSAKLFGWPVHRGDDS